MLNHIKQELVRARELAADSVSADFKVFVDRLDRQVANLEDQLCALKWNIRLSADAAEVTAEPVPIRELQDWTCDINTMMGVPDDQ